MGHRSVLCHYCNNQLMVENPTKDQKISCPVCKKTTMVNALPYDVEELTFYPLKKPFSYVSIIKELESLTKHYLVLEPWLTNEDTEVLEFLKETLVKSLTVRLDTLEEKAESYLVDAVNDILVKYEIPLEFTNYKKILYFLKQRFLGYDIIDPLMNDPTIEDISCDGTNTPIFVYQREYGSLESNVEFIEDEILAKFVIKLAQKCGKHISVSDPMLDATMPDGSRIQMTLRGEVTTRGSTFTIRKFRSDPITPVDLVNYETFSLKMIAYMWMAVEQGYNALISGGTASGKTSTLNALALFVPKESKIVSIEETREINLPHPNWIPGVTRSGFGEVANNRVTGEIDLFDLMKAALRQRPEYILVGEIRGKEAYVLFQAMATGHTTYSTVHADTTQALIHRLEGKPINIPRTMLQSLDIVLLMRTQKTQNKQQRRCIKIVELLNVDSETNEVLTNTVFEWNPAEQSFEYSGKSFILEQIHELMDMNIGEISEEIQNRSKILEWMRKYNIREFIDVGRILAKYAETPKDILELIKNPPEKMDEEIKEELLSEHEHISSILNLAKNDYQSIAQKEETKKDTAHKIHSLFSLKPKKDKKKNKKKSKKSSVFYNTRLQKKDSGEKLSDINKTVLTNKKPVSFFSRKQKTEKMIEKKHNEITRLLDSNETTLKKKSSEKKGKKTRVKTHYRKVKGKKKRTKVEGYERKKDSEDKSSKKKK